MNVRIGQKVTVFGGWSFPQEGEVVSIQADGGVTVRYNGEEVQFDPNGDQRQPEGLATLDALRISTEIDL